MKAVKIIFGLIVVLALILAGVIYVGMKNIDVLVKRTVESAGSRVTETRVNLEKVNIQMARGRGELNNLIIGNPPGFNSDHALRLGQIVLRIEPQSLLEPVIVIGEMRVAGAELIAEQRDLVDSNLQQLLKNIKSQTSGSGGGRGDKTGDNNAGGEGGPAPQEGGDDGAVRLMVEKLAFVDSSVRLITEEWGDHAYNLPDIELDGLGDPQTGLTPDQLGQAILKPVIEQAREKVATELKRRAGRAVERKLKEKLDGKERETLDTLKQLLDQE